jgi:hypothetical protein
VHTLLWVWLQGDVSNTPFSHRLQRVHCMSVTLVHAAIKYDSAGHICEHCLHILFDEMLYLDVKYVLSVIQFVTFSHTTSFVALQGIAAYVLPS